MGKPEEHRRQARLMGTTFEFIVIADSGESIIDEGINEVKRIESLLTEFSATSQTSLINNAAGSRPVPVDPEVYDIVKRSKQLSGITQGAFDITSGVLKKMYNFKGGKSQMPDKEKIRDALNKVGSEKIALSGNNSVSLTIPGMHVGFGAIGKGYAADRVKTLFRKRGVKNGVISASGDLTAWGTRADRSPWKIGIADPAKATKPIGWLMADNISIATSGNYEQYFELDGERYSHNINPKTGMPVKGIKSVTVVSPRAELSDALATAVTVMGVDIGIHFINQLPDTHCMIIDDRNKIFTSQRMKFVS